MTAVAHKAPKAEIVCDGHAGQKTSETQAKGPKKKQLDSPSLGLAFRKFFRHKVCILFTRKVKRTLVFTAKEGIALPLHSMTGTELQKMIKGK